MVAAGNDDVPKIIAATITPLPILNNIAYSTEGFQNNISAASANIRAIKEGDNRLIKGCCYGFGVDGDRIV
jgi:hypothetical protein